MFSFFSVLLIFFLTSVNSFGKPLNLPNMQENTKPKEEKYFKLGFMGVYVSEVYKEADPTILPFPLLLIRGYDFYFEGTSAGYEYKRNGLVFRVFGKFDSSFAFNSDTSDFLKGMKDRDAGLNLGMRLAYTFQSFHTIQMDVEKDISDTSGGLLAKINYKYLWIIDETIVNIFGVGVKLYNKKYLSYYFDLDKANRDKPTNTVLSTTSDYKITSNTANLYLENTFFMKINESWSFLTFFSYEKFAKEIKRSPLVDKDEKLIFVVGPIYRF